jgi:hypothetical protein
MHAAARCSLGGRTAVALLVTLIAVTATGYAASAAEKEPVRRTVYGEAAPANAPGQQFYLQQVVVDPGGKLPEHFHEGTQLATIRSGVLTYHVVSGTAVVARANGSTNRYEGPKVVTLRRGDVLVEDESLAHYGSNKGTKPVVLEVAALLRDGAPLSTPVGGGDPDTKPVHVESTMSSPSRTLHQVGGNGEKTYGWNLLEGSATVDGQPVQVELQGSVNYTNGGGPFSAFVTFTFADGSTLGASAQGVASTIERRNATTFAATMLVIGGTGAYAPATGSGTFTGSRTEELGGNVSLTFDLGLR